MKSEIVNVTPQMASDWLQRNTDNRPLYRTVVNGIKAAMLRGEYMQTHQGIAFDENGILMDGQHRLTAISELSDGSFPMLVTWGIPREAFKVMDIGLKRSAADALREDRRLVEAARLIAAIGFNKRGSITPTQLIPIINRIRPHHDALTLFCGSRSKVWSSAPIRAAAVVSIIRGADADYVKSMYRALVLYEATAMTTVVGALAKSISNGSVRATDFYDLFSRCLVAFDPRNAALSKIQIKDHAKYIALVRAIFRIELTQNEDHPPPDDPNKKAASEAAKGVIRRHLTLDARDRVGVSLRK